MAINLKDPTLKSIKQNIIAFPGVSDSNINSGYGLLLFDADNTNVSCHIKDIRAKLLDNTVSGAKVSLNAYDGTNYFSIAKNIPVNSGNNYVGQTVSLINESTSLWLSNDPGEIQKLYAEVNNTGFGVTHFEIDYELFWLDITPASQATLVTFTTPGTTSWTAPTGAYAVDVVAVGGGGGGFGADSVDNGGGGGGGLGTGTVNISGGSSYTVAVGAAGLGGGANGGDSYFIDTSTVAGLGGESSQGSTTPGTGGGFVGTGGGNGGSGGAGNLYGGGGGGAGGYSGNGGTGAAGTSNGNAGTSGSGGGGGGGASGHGGGGGGGVGILGEGANGGGGSGAGDFGNGGSGGANGTAGPGSSPYNGGNGGNYGGGGGGGADGNRPNSYGGQGAVALTYYQTFANPNAPNPPTLDHNQRYIQSAISMSLGTSNTVELFESQNVSGSYSWSLSGTTTNISPTSGTVTFTNGYATINFTTTSAPSDQTCTFATSGNEFTSTFNLTTGSVTVDSTPLSQGTPYTVNYTGSMGTITVVGTVTVDLEAQGGAGGRGQWSTNNDPGGPGGQVVARYTLTTGTYYYFVGEGNKGVSGKAGAGGGSTDVRTTYSNGSTFDRTAFLDNTSLNSRIIVAGGGGGAHGGTYGYWGYTNSPGAGGPTTTQTNSRGTNDGGHVATGASTTAGGLDGGSSTSINYTANGQFGHGGIQSSPLQTLSYSSTTSYSGWGWPNGGSGTTWANGGGGGGWYGGATNWPNGGGGSNYTQSSGGATLVSTTTNVGEIQTGNGFLTVTWVS